MLHQVLSAADNALNHLRFWRGRMAHAKLNAMPGKAFIQRRPGELTRDILSSPDSILVKDAFERESDAIIRKRACVERANRPGVIVAIWKEEKAERVVCPHVHNWQPLTARHIEPHSMALEFALLCLFPKVMVTRYVITRVVVAGRGVGP